RADKKSTLQKIQECQIALESTQQVAAEATKITQERRYLFAQAEKQAKEQEEAGIKKTKIAHPPVMEELKSAIAYDQQECDRDLRVFETTTKTDHERGEKTKSVEQEAVTLESNEKIKIAREKAIEAETNRGKAIEAEANGKPEVAQAWREVAKKNQLSAESHTKAALVHAAGKLDESKNWDDAGFAYSKAAYRLEKVAKYLENAKEAEANGKPEVAQAWREVAKQNKLYNEYYTQEATALSSGKQNEYYDNWNNLGQVYSRMAECLEKGIETEVSGKPEVAQAWCEIAKQNQLTLECHRKIVVADMRITYANWFGDTFLHNNSHVAYAKAVNGLEKVTDSLEKIIEVEATAKPEVAQVWRNAVKYNQLIAEAYNKSAIAYDAGNLDEGKNWGEVPLAYRRAVCRLEKLAECLEKAIETEANGKPEVAKAWREVVKKRQLAAEAYDKAAAAYPEGKTDGIYPLWRYAGDRYEEGASNLEKAIKAEADGKPELVQAWRDVVKQNQLEAESYTKAATAYAEGKKDESKNWDRASSVYRFAASRLQSTVGLLEEAIKAEIKGRSGVVQAWREAAKQKQLAAGYYTEKAAAISLGNDKYDYVYGMYNPYDKSGYLLKKVAEHLEKSVEAEANGKPEVAQAWREAAKQDQLTAEAYDKAAAASGVMRYDEKNNWVNVGDILDAAASAYDSAADDLESVAMTLEKVIEAERSGKPEVAQVWREAVKKYQLAAESNIKVAVAYAAGKKDEGDSLSTAYRAACEKADALKEQAKVLNSNPEGKRSDLPSSEVSFQAVEESSKNDELSSDRSRSSSISSSSSDSSMSSSSVSSMNLEHNLLGLGEEEKHPEEKITPRAFSSAYNVEKIAQVEQSKQAIFEAEKAEQVAQEKVLAVSQQLEEAKQALAECETQINKKESLKPALKAAKEKVQAELAILQSEKTRAIQMVEQRQAELELMQQALIKATAAIQEARVIVDQEAKAAAIKEAQAKEKELAEIEKIKAAHVPLREELKGIIEYDQQECDRGQRVFEATKKIDQEREVKEKSIAVQVQTQRIIAEKKREGEAAFARARAAKSESGWNEAKAAAMSISNYWNEVVEAIQTGRSSLALSQEEAAIQKNCWLQKAGVAEVKALGASPLGQFSCDDSHAWVIKRNRADGMMAMIKDKVWPFTSQAMKAFIEYPSRARMLAVREFASASASAFASSSESASVYVSTAHERAYA
ncbi:MAG TPA: hypothetical protein VJK54_02715, partial [Chthoniobacterales bacterium]|nr:hypothetical protein [Chthoniobacterales bacterium]